MWERKEKEQMESNENIFEIRPTTKLPVTTPTPTDFHGIDKVLRDGNAIRVNLAPAMALLLLLFSEERKREKILPPDLTYVPMRSVSLLLGRSKSANDNAK